MPSKKTYKKALNKAEEFLAQRDKHIRILERGNDEHLNTIVELEKELKEQDKVIDEQVDEINLLKSQLNDKNWKLLTSDAKTIRSARIERDNKQMEEKLKQIREIVNG